MLRQGWRLAWSSFGTLWLLAVVLLLMRDVVDRCPLSCLACSCLTPAAKGATALMAAAVQGRADVVSALLSNGVSPSLAR